MFPVYGATRQLGAAASDHDVQRGIPIMDIFQDHLTDRSRDTVYVKDVQYEYKYKLLRDTVYKVQIDTIPVIREVEVVKTEKYVPAIYKWSLAICIALIILIVLSIAKKFFL